MGIKITKVMNDGISCSMEGEKFVIEVINHADFDFPVTLEEVGKGLVQLSTEDHVTLPIRLRTEVEFEEPMAVFDRIFIMSPDNQLVPFSHIVNVSFGPAQTDILH